MTVIIPTRDRPVDIERCVASVLRCDHDAFEVVVVDQSRQPANLPDDPRLVHVLSDSRGKSAALNAAVALANGPVLAFTDDDCTVPRGWLGEAEALFEAHPDVDMICGDLVAIDHDPDVSFVPTTSIEQFEVVHGAAHNFLKAVAGADIVVRKTRYERIGGFDEEIGPGARFRGAEEVDFLYRVLRSGAAVARTPDLWVLHWGVRDRANGAALALLKSYEYGGGAVLAKHLLLGDMQVVVPTLSTFAHGADFALRECLRGRTWAMELFGAKLRGFAEGIRRGVDRTHRTFRRDDAKRGQD